MKRLWILLLVVCLTGCAPRSPWAADWTDLGGQIGVEPQEGWTLQRNEDVLAAEGIYYATWTQGQPEAQTDAEGNTVQVYPAQMHLLLAQPEDPEKEIENWNALAQERYTLGAAQIVQCGGQSFQTVLYTVPGAKGVFATARWGDRAIQAELKCREDFPAEPLELLSDFLNHCHYAG